MANFCNFEIRVKGKRGNALLVYASMPAVDECPVTYSAGTDNHYEIHFHGCTKWSVNFDVTDDWDGRDIDVDLNTLSDRDIHALGNSLWGYSLKAKSRVLACEILVCYWSDESDFNQFDHYVNGICVKQRKISYFPDEAEFDWDTLEFENHEGEYDETIVGDRLGEIVMGNVMSEFQHMGNPTHHLVDDYEGLINLKELFTKVAAELDDEDDEDEYDEDEDDSPAWADQFTSEELFEWKFTQGNHYEGDGWSVAIPDGLCKWEGLYADSDSDVIFVPELYRFEPDIRHNPAPVCVFANTRSTPTPSMLFPEMSRVFHRFARIGYSVMLNKLFAEEEDAISDIHPFATDDFNGTMALTNLDDGSLGVDVAILSEKTMHLVKIFAQQIPEEDIDSFIRSLEKWFETYQNPGNEYKIEQILEDQDQCIGQLLNDDISCIEQAVKQCILEYNLSVNGRTQCLEYRCENEFVPAYEVEEQAKQILKDAFEVKRYFVERLDDFLEHANQYEISKDTMCQVYGKLLELEQSTEGGRLNIDGNEYHIKSPMPLSLRLKFKRWQEVADELTHTDPPAAYTSSLGLQAVHEAEQKHAQWLEKYSDAISDQPDITIPGKKFVFTGLGVMKHDQQNHPAVQNLMAHGGLYRSSVSGVTDYLVVGKVDPGEAKIRDAIAQQKAGKPIQIIRLEDLEAVVKNQQGNTRKSTFAAKYPPEVRPTKKPSSPTLPEKTSVSVPSNQPTYTIDDGILTHAEIPDGCTEIVIPQNVNRIKKEAICSSSLTKATLPKNVEVVEHFAFKDCKNLKTVSILNPEAIIHCYTFGPDLSKFKQHLEFFIPHKLTYLRNFYPGATIHYIDSENISSQNNEPRLIICDQKELIAVTFPKGCTNLSIPEGIRQIGSHAIAHAPIETVSFPSTLFLIGGEVFNGCSNLRSVMIPEGVTSLGLYPFNDCEQLSYLQFPSTLHLPVHGEILGCPNLKTIVCLNDQVAELWNTMSYRTDITWYIPSSLKSEAQKRLGSGAKVRWLTDDECALLRNGATLKEIENKQPPMQEKQYATPKVSQIEQKAANAKKREEKERKISERKAVQQEHARKQEERERKKAARRVAEQKQVKIEQLKKEKEELLQELNATKGLFAGFKRNKLQIRINEIETHLRRLERGF